MGDDRAGAKWFSTGDAVRWTSTISTGTKSPEPGRTGFSGSTTRRSHDNHVHPRSVHGPVKSLWFETIVKGGDSNGVHWYISFKLNWVNVFTLAVLLIVFLFNFRLQLIQFIHARFSALRDGYWLVTLSLHQLAHGRKFPSFLPGFLSPYITLAAVVYEWNTSTK